MSTIAEQARYALDNWKLSSGERILMIELLAEHDRLAAENARLQARLAASTACARELEVRCAAMVSALILVSHADTFEDARDWASEVWGKHVDLAPWKRLVEAVRAFRAAIAKGRSECECGEVPCEHVSASDELLTAVVELDNAALACGMGER